MTTEDLDRLEALHGAATKGRTMRPLKGRYDT